MNYSEEIKYPWERRTGETLKAFDAFCTYRDMGKKRSVRSVAEALNKSVTLIARWSSGHKWVKRVEKYEDYLARETMLDNEELIKNAKRREMLVGTTMMNKLIERINSLQPEEIGVQAIPQIAKTSSELVRLGLDVYTQSSRTEITGPDGQVLPQLPQFQVVFDADGEPDE